MATPGTPLLPPRGAAHSDPRRSARPQPEAGLFSSAPALPAPAPRAPAVPAPAVPAPAAAAGPAAVEDYLPLVRHAVHRAVSRLPGHVASDELLAAGLLALVEASRSFDPHRGVPFAPFAAHRVTGAILDELRRSDWAPRSVRRRERELDQIGNQLTVQLRQQPSRAQVAAAAGLSAAQLAGHTRDLNRASLVSLHDLGADTLDGLLRVRPVQPDVVLLHRERLSYLRDAVAALPDRLRRVIEGTFFHDKPGAVLAAELGIGQPRVSQLRTEALTLLRHGLDTVLDPELAGSTRPVTAAVRRHRVDYVTRLSALHTSRERLTYIPDTELLQAA